MEKMISKMLERSEIEKIFSEYSTKEYLKSKLIFENQIYENAIHIKSSKTVQAYIDRLSNPSFYDAGPGHSISLNGEVLEVENTSVVVQ